MWNGNRLGVSTYPGSFGPEFASRLEKGDPWFVGFGQRVAIVDPIEPRKMEDADRALGPFFSFLVSGGDAPLVAVFEAGVAAYDWAGHLEWAWAAPDIIIDWHIEGPVLEVSCYEGAQARLGLLDGQPVAS